MSGLYDGLPTALTASQVRGIGRFFFWSGLAAAPFNFFAFLVMAALGDWALERSRTLLEIPEFWMALIVLLAVASIAARRLGRPLAAALLAGLQLPLFLVTAAPLALFSLRS